MPNYATREVPLSAIEPSGMNPRKTFDHIDELADAIRATGGVPVNPPVCVLDGGMYRIVDGERRYRALQKIYADEPDRSVPVIVVDDYDDAAELRAMLATDSKDQLTPDEKAAGIQLMLKLDIPPVDIHRISGATVENVELARGYAKNHPETLDQTKFTLDTLAAMAAAELDADETQEVCDAEYPEVALRNVINARRWRENRDKVIEVCEGVGAHWTARSEYDGEDDLVVLGSSNRPESIGEMLQEADHLEDVLVVIDDAGWSQVLGNPEDEKPRYPPEYYKAEAAADAAEEAADAILTDVLDHLSNYWATGMRKPPENLASIIKGARAAWSPMNGRAANADVEKLERVAAEDDPSMREVIQRLADLSHRSLFSVTSWNQQMRVEDRSVSLVEDVLWAADDDGIALSDEARAYPDLVRAARDAKEELEAEDED